MPGVPIGHTSLWEISDAGQIAGYCGNGTSNQSFVATPTPTDVPEPASATLLTLSLAAALTARRRWLL